MITIVTSCYGGYDQPLPIPRQTVEFEHIIVSDQSIAVDGATTIVEPRPQLHPRLAAKVAKCRPDLYAPDAEVIIWIDSSIEVTSDHFVQHYLDKSSGLLNQLAHPNRDNIVDEVAASEPMVKYAGLPLRGQIDWYLSNSAFLPGLWATGLIVYAPFGSVIQRAKLRVFGDAWLMEQIRWTYQDQLSEVIAAYAAKIDIQTIPGDLWAPEHFRLRGHAHDG